MSATLTYTHPISGELVAFEFDIVSGESHGASASVSDHPVEEGTVISDHVNPDPRTLNLTVRVSDTPINMASLQAIVGAPLLGGPVRVRLASARLKRISDLRVTGGYGLGALLPSNAITGITGRGYVEPRVEPAEFEAMDTSIDAQFFGFTEQLQRRMWVHRNLTALCLEGRPVQVSTEYRYYPSMLITQVTAARDGTRSQTFDIQMREFRTATTQSVTLKAKPRPAQKRAEPLKPAGKKGVGYDTELPEKSSDWYQVTLGNQTRR